MTAGIHKAARDLQAARDRLGAAKAAAKEVARQAHADGMPETEIARLFSVNRMTVRRWLDKL